MASNTDFLLALESVAVSFDGFRAVDGLNLYVDYGELRVIIGPNGAGKTTVLDLICGRTRTSEGSIKFKNQEITSWNEQEIVRRGIGRKFQTPTIYEDLTVFENLELSIPRGRDVFGALMWKRTPEVIQQVREVAEMIFLRDQLGETCRDLKSRPKAVAGDRHAPYSGSGATHARRAGGWNERRGTGQDRSAAQVKSSKTAL